MTDHAVQAEASAIAEALGKAQDGLENFRAILREITAERAMQDAQWGGPKHDDMNRTLEWFSFIDDQADKLIFEIYDVDDEATVARMARARLIKIAALAVAGVQSIDRIGARMVGGGA